MTEVSVVSNSNTNLVNKALTNAAGNKEADSSASGIPDQSFMTLIQQAGIGVTNSSSNSSQLDQIVTNFVSKQVRRLCYRLCQSIPFDPSKPEERKLPELTPSAVDSFAAVVMVDVSGYSKLTAALAERGPVGAELLSKTMKGYLDQIIEVIVSYGGDIIKFAGDAVIVYWKSEKAINMQDSSEDIERGELVYKASHCCLTLLTKLGTYDINIADCATKTLRIHLGIGAGLIADVLVGGAPGRWEHFVAGDGVNQLSQVLDLAKAGELALSHQALKWLVFVVDIRTLNLGNYDKRCIILTGLAQAERRVPAPQEVKEEFTMSSPRQLEDNMIMYKYFMDRTALFKLQSDVNQSNLFQLDAGLLELLNLTELRQITTIFIKIATLQGVERDELLEQSQDAIQVVQNALHRCDGSLRQFHVDDKGAVILCFFGLPPLAHENDSKLGISAGIEIRDKFLDMFEEFSMGITTGVVSFGGVGTNGRAEYAVMGDAINMAARLMCNKEAKRGILCDEKTFNLCESDFQFENLGETTVKGKNTPIAIFRPNCAIPEAEKNNNTKNQLTSSSVIGREMEKQAVLNTITQLTNSHVVDILLFNAEGGQGLSTLAHYAKTEAQKLGCHFCTGKAVQMEQNNSFFIFRSLVHDMINLLDMGSRNSQGQFKIPSVGPAVNITSLPIQPAIDPLKAMLSHGSMPSKSSASNKEKLRLVMDNNNPPVPETIPEGSAEQKLRERRISRRASLFKAFTVPGEAEPTEPAADEGNTNALGISENSVDKNAENANRRQSNAAMDSPEADSEELFSIRFKMVLDKLECNENQAALLQLVTRQHEDESDAIAQAHLRLHARDLCAILLKMLNTLTAHNKIIMMITEAHYVDTLSWDLLLELAVACPRLAIFSYARPESTYESKENRRIYKLIEQLPRSRSLLLTGLSQEETSSLILATWTGHTITSVDPKIAESIYKRTDGNPFFIRSLVLALKESGQCRISPTGALTTPDASFDFDKLVLGYDNQSIILAQFDRLDRNFQLFLKVASVLGQKFALDDVLFFLTNTPGASEQLDKKKYAQIIVGLQTTDKYGFLQRESLGPDGQYFIFKSAVVRKCIYNLMVHNQRQQIHLLIAQFLEGKINEQNKHRYVVPILDHYMNTSAKYQNKRLLYTEMAANYFSEKESNSDSIKYFKQLLEIIEDISPEELKQITSLQVANWHRELGNALLIKDELSEAEQHLLASLKIMGVTLPEPGYKFKWAMYKQLRKRAVLNKTFFQDRPVPQEEDYTQSYVARKGASGYSLSNIVTSNSKDKKPESTSAVQLEKNAGEKESSVNILPKPVAISPAQQIIRDTRENILAATQHALVILAEVFLKQSNFPSHDYTVLLGLNLSTEKSTEVHISRLFALGALSLKLRGGKDTILPAQYMEAAVSFDQRVDIHTSLKLVVNGASLLLLGGQLEACNNKLEVVSYLSGMAGDLQSRVFGLHLKATLQTHSCPRETALTTARVLYTLSSQRESRIGKVWGCYHIIQNLLGDKTAVDEILLMVKEMKEAYSLCSDQGKINMLPVEIAMESTLILVPHFTKFPKNLNESLTKLCDLIPRIPFFQWLSFVGMSPLALALNAEIFQGPIEDAETLKLIQLVCDKANVAMKSIKGLALHGPIRRMFKGIKLMAVKKNKAAAKAWMKANDENAEDLLTQATIHSAIAISGEDTKDSAGKVEDIIRDLHVKAKFAVLFPQN